MAIISHLAHSACPHDCPSTCALNIEVMSDGKIDRLYGAPDNSYTSGVICAKVSRYKERLYHPDRLLKPLVRAGAKGEGKWKEASFDAALDLIAEKFTKTQDAHGAQAIWPYYYAGTMGLVQRDGINRLRHAMGYSNQFSTICVNPAWTGFIAGVGKLAGPDPREMQKSDCIVIWGTNAVATQINVMSHVTKARKKRGAKVVVIDVYNNATMKTADMALVVRPGTDGALACAVMHCLFRDGYANRQYLAQYSDDPVGLEAHLQNKTPQWASDVTGLSVEEIERFAALIGPIKRTYLRLGYGFTRNRNGAVNMHAATSIATVLGAWEHEGGGAFHNNGGIYALDQSEIEGSSFADPSVRHLDQSKIGRVLTGDSEALYGGPAVRAMLVQNTNPANVAPEQNKVIEGLRRDDLFVAVHEQFMTDTAQLADVVLPATMFMEHDDIYRSGGHQHIVLGPKIVEPPHGPRSNHDVINGLAQRLGVGDLPGFGVSERELISNMLEKRGLGDFESLREKRWADVQPSFEEAHYVNGFAFADKKFHFKPNWAQIPMSGRPPQSIGSVGPHEDLPCFPDHMEFIEAADEEHPFRLVTSPARQFLNSTFSETPSGIKREICPSLMLHELDGDEYSIATGDRVLIGNHRGEVILTAQRVSGVRRGVVIAEGLWPNSAHENAIGINALVGADAIAPYGGVGFHDTKVWLKLLKK